MSASLAELSLTHWRSIPDGVELMIIIVATFGQAISGQAPAIHIIGALCVWRFLVSRNPHSAPSGIFSEPQFRWVSVSAVITHFPLSSPPSSLLLGFVAV
jgi:hypothetical protein